jgi:heme-degrading monooxygenase HmoA
MPSAIPSNAVRSVLYLEPRGGDQGAIVDFYRGHDVLGRSIQQPGCLACELHVPRDGSGPILVTALWESPEAYQGWVDDPVRAEWAAALGELVEGGFGPSTKGGIYDVVIATGSGA